MSENEKFYRVSLKEKASEENLLAIKEKLEEYDSFAGELNYNLEEAEVDELLGKKAFCGGEIPEELFETLEKSQQNQPESFFFTQIDDVHSFQDFLKGLRLENNLEEQTVQDWNEEWRKSYEAIVVNSELSVIPSWEKEKDSKDHVYIYPGMGFGTGGHQTTFLCLKLFCDIQEKFKEGARALDFGCGSGILGIAAIKKFRSVVDFVDIDPDALDNCVQNLELNDFLNYSEGHTLVLRERYKVDQKYPLIFANILEGVLLEEKNILIDSLEEGGMLIVSGLLNHQTKAIKNSYTELNCVSEISKDDWSAILFEKSVNS